MGYGVRVRNTSGGSSGGWATYVKRAREGVPMSQSELARRLGTDRTTVWRWENDRQRPENADVVAAVARVLQLDQEEALAAAGLRPGVEAPAEPTRELDEELELVRTDPRLPPDVKLRIIKLIVERRERERLAAIEETKRVIELFRDRNRSA